jgi:hypothetical protein
MGNKLPTLHAEVPAFYGKWPQGKCPRALDPWRPAGVPIPIAGAHFKDPAPPRRWLLTDDARPNERQTRDAEQAEHDLVNPMIADAMVSARRAKHRREFQARPTTASSLPPHVKSPFTASAALRTVRLYAWKHPDADPCSIREAWPTRVAVDRKVPPNPPRIPQPRPIAASAKRLAQPIAILARPTRRRRDR